MSLNFDPKTQRQARLRLEWACQEWKANCKKINLFQAIGLQVYFLFPFPALSQCLPIDGKANTSSWFFCMEMLDQSNFITTGSFSFPPPYTREEKNHLDVAGIKPRWASTTSRHSGHYTLTSWTSNVKLLWVTPAEQLSRVELKQKDKDHRRHFLNKHFRAIAKKMDFFSSGEKKATESSNERTNVDQVKVLPGRDRWHAHRCKTAPRPLVQPASESRP